MMHLEGLSLFCTAAAAVFMEAAPFLLLGSLVGAAIEVFVSEETMTRRLPKSAAGRIVLGLFAGMLLPTCECGVVPVARRLLLKGVPPCTAIPYMLAAPVVNPVVMGSTLFAFQGDVGVMLLRCLFVIVPAAGLGIALRDAPPRLILKQRPIDLRAFSEIEDAAAPADVACGCGCGHDHGHGAGGRVKALLFHTAAEFLSMSRFLVLGAVVAAAFKTYAPTSMLQMFSENALLAVVGLMLLAVLLSVCSEADAFVAASFASFPNAAQIAFMAIGPMVDLKLIPMFYAVFNKRIAMALIVVPTISVFAMAALMALGD